MNGFVLPLDAVEATLEVAGGKGTNLGRLVRAGFPVPPGFLITTAAYHAFVAANELEARIAQISRAASSGDSTPLEDASHTIRQLFEQGTIPEDLVNAIKQAYRDLNHAAYDQPAHLIGEIQITADHSSRAGDSTAQPRSGQTMEQTPVAVRSSATAEDLPDASFAGQQETYLHVRGEDALLRAVQRCWASLWTARAMAYRARQGIDPASVRLAVVVQHMVPADASGILFTVNPLTGIHDEAVINAAWGLGEAIVGGRVTPDTVVVDKASGQVTYEEIGDKGVMTVPVAEGTAEVQVDPPQRRQAVLRPERAVELARLGRQIETYFREPQDIEWALADGRFFILQSRAVTALPATRALLPPQAHSVPGDDAWPTVDEYPAQPFDLWTRANVGEIYPQPVSPLTWSGITIVVNTWLRHSPADAESARLKIERVKRFYGRVYFNEGAIAYALSHEYGLPASFMKANDAAFGNRGNVDYASQMKFNPVRFLRQLPVVLRISLSRWGTDRQLEALFPQIERWMVDFQGWNLESSSDRELWTQLATVWAERTRQLAILHIMITNSAMTAFSTLRAILRGWVGRKELAHDLVAGLSGVYVAEMAPALWEMTRMLRERALENIILENPPDVALAQLSTNRSAGPVLEKLDFFLQRHGHRCANGGDLLYPRWSEAPEQIIEVLASYLKAGDRVNPVEVEDRQRRRREEAVAWVEANLNPIRRAIFRQVLARAQDAVRLRDNSKHFSTKLSYPRARVYRVLGQRWVERGWLRERDDFFFLAIPEIDTIIQASDPAALGRGLLTIVDERRKAFDYWLGVEAPEVIGADGQPVPLPPVEDESGVLLRGVPASSGRAEGTARIVEDPREASRLQPGDILVTRSTDPGWTPVFPLLAGLVLEIGGQLSHGAIVAREYGVPAVVNVHEAMRRIQDGQTITVEGTAGHVYLGDT